MVVKQNKDGTWSVVTKAGPLGKTKFSTKGAAESRARGPGKKGKGKGKGKAVAKKSKGGTSATSTSSRVGTGRMYQGARLTALVLAPVSHQIIGVVTQGKNPTLAGEDLLAVVKSKPHAAHQIVNVADIIVDRSRKVGQAAALSRGSITAWLPEGYLLGKGVQDVLIDNLGAEAVHTRYIQRQTGWSGISNTWVPQRARMYRILKHGGQAIRIGASRIKILQRVKRALTESILAPLGGHL